MGHWLRDTIWLVFGAIAAAAALRVVRARNVSSTLAHRGAEEAARHEPFPPLAAPAQGGAWADPSAASTEDLGRPPTPPLPLATVAIDPQHTVQAVPVAIIGGGGAGLGPGGAAAPGPPSYEQVEAAVTKRGLRVRGRHYGLKVVLATIGIALLVLVGAAFLAMKLLMGGGDDAAGSDENLAVLPPGASAVTTTTLAAGEEVLLDTIGSGAAAEATSTAGEGASDGSGGAGNDGGAGGASPTLKPPDGNYSYAGSGTFELKILGMSSRTSPYATVPAAVATASGDCWTLRLDTQADKSEVATYCNPAPGTLTSPGDVQIQKQFGLSIVATVVCPEPRTFVVPAMAPGQVFPEQCEIRNKGAISSTSATKGTRTFVGMESVVIGGQEVLAYHIYQNVTLSGGDVSGPTTADSWYSATNGMLLKSVRKQRMTGFASYNEDTVYLLKSLSPG